MPQKTKRDLLLLNQQLQERIAYLEGVNQSNNDKIAEQYATIMDYRYHFVAMKGELSVLRIEAQLQSAQRHIERMEEENNFLTLMLRDYEEEVEEPEMSEEEMELEADHYAAFMETPQVNEPFTTVNTPQFGSSLSSADFDIAEEVYTDY